MQGDSAIVAPGQLWFDSSQNKLVIVFHLDSRFDDCPWSIWFCRRFFPGDTNLADGDKRIYLTGGIFDHPYMRRIA